MKFEILTEHHSHLSVSALGGINLPYKTRLGEDFQTWSFPTVCNS